MNKQTTMVSGIQIVYLIPPPIFSVPHVISCRHDIPHFWGTVAYRGFKNLNVTVKGKKIDNWVTQSPMWNAMRSGTLQSTQLHDAQPNSTVTYKEHGKILSGSVVWSCPRKRKCYSGCIIFATSFSYTLRRLWLKYRRTLSWLIQMNQPSQPEIWDITQHHEVWQLTMPVSRQNKHNRSCVQTSN